MRGSISFRRAFGPPAHSPPGHRELPEASRYRQRASTRYPDLAHRRPTHPERPWRARTTAAAPANAARAARSSLPSRQRSARPRARPGCGIPGSRRGCRGRSRGCAEPSPACLPSARARRRSTRLRRRPAPARPVSGRSGRIPAEPNSSSRFALAFCPSRRRDAWECPDRKPAVKSTPAQDGTLLAAHWCWLSAGRDGTDNVNASAPAGAKRESNNRSS